MVAILEGRDPELVENPYASTLTTTKPIAGTVEPQAKHVHMESKPVEPPKPSEEPASEEPPSQEEPAQEEVSQPEPPTPDAPPADSDQPNT